MIKLERVREADFKDADLRDTVKQLNRIIENLEQQVNLEIMFLSERQDTKGQ